MYSPGQINSILKRTFDLLLSVACLLLFWPLLVVCALWVIFDSSGPAIFTQNRVGRGGGPFKLFKFLTMKVENAGPLITIGLDPRITRSGQFLRQWKLD